MTVLERAIQIAVQAHEGQTDKAGEAYILHPLRLMMQMETDAERAVAVLHDVVEDSSWTLPDLRNEGISDDVITAVECLTKRQGEGYLDFVRRACKNPVARRVKIADIEDNADLSRIANPTEEDYRRNKEKYEPALEILKTND